MKFYYDDKKSLGTLFCGVETFLIKSSELSSNWGDGGSGSSLDLDSSIRSSWLLWPILRSSSFAVFGLDNHFITLSPESLITEFSTSSSSFSDIHESSSKSCFECSFSSSAVVDFFVYSLFPSSSYKRPD